MANSSPSLEIPADSVTDGIYRVPAELLDEVFKNCDTRDLCRCIRVCHLWKARIHDYPMLWTDLDLIVDFTRPSPFPSVLQRSAQLPLSVICRYSTRYDADIICRHLAPHMHRVRDLSLLSHGIESYRQVFDTFLRTPAPILRALDVSTGTAAPYRSNFDHMQFAQPQPPSMMTGHTSTIIPEQLFGSVPSALRQINCGAHYMPHDHCPALSTVTTVRLNIGAFNHCALRRACAVFPRMEELEVRNCCDADAVGLVPNYHPLRTARLVSREERNTISWADLVAGCYTQLPHLQLERFHPSVVASVSTDPEWTARSLTLDINARSTAIFVAGYRTCRILQTNSQYLLSLPALTQNVRGLTISLASGSPPMPDLDLPRLTALTILCGRAPEAGIVGNCGLLLAPRLLAVQLATPETGGYDFVDPRLLAQFISEHVQTQGADLPSLSANKRHILIPSDTEGLASLTCVVHNVETCV